MRHTQYRYKKAPLPSHGGVAFSHLAQPTLPGRAAAAHAGRFHARAHAGLHARIARSPAHARSHDPVMLHMLRFPCAEWWPTAG